MDLSTWNRDTKVIAGLMMFAGLFSLVGNTIQQGGIEPKSGKVGTDGRIIIGATVGTALLVLIAHAGEAGYKFATGLATVAAVSSMLVYSKSIVVWTTLDKSVTGSSQPTGGTGTTGSTGTPTSVTSATYQQLPEQAGEAAVATAIV